MPIVNLKEKIVSDAEMEAFVPTLMRRKGVPGLQIAAVHNGEIVYNRGFGLRNVADGKPVTIQTAFAGASLSKTVFAYIVMQLVQENRLDLDKPLHTYFKTLPAKYADVAGDERLKRVTARMALSHQTGFPNWRWISADKKLAFRYAPGERFWYSGEGIQYLQLAVEQITGSGLDELSRMRVFKLLGMTRTRYIWQTDFADDHATGYDEAQKAVDEEHRDTAGAAGSIVITAQDYARFLIAVTNAKGLDRKFVDAMFSPQIRVRFKRMFGPGASEATTDNEARQLAWGLGWGLFASPHGRAFFHGGHDDGFEHYSVTFLEKKISIVILTNSGNGEDLMQELLRHTIGDTYSAFDWMGYAP